MTASVKILTTSTIDSAPSIILISPNGHRTLVNCGEGCQRSFLESASDRVRSVNQICLTHIHHTSVGGLPGLILTSADAAQASHDASSGTGDGVEKSDTATGTLKIIGPIGTKDYIHSLRHFVKRDRFPLTIHEGEYEAVAKEGHGVVSRNTKEKKRKINDDKNENDLGMFSVKTIPMARRIPKKGKDNAIVTVETGVASFIFTTTPISGKFQVERAKAIGIPLGPLYAKLKQGQTITFQHPETDKKITVRPDQVLDAGNSGVTVILIYCPDEYVFDQIQQNHLLQSYHGSNSSLELIIHYTPKHIFQSKQYCNWMKLFSTETKHITLHSNGGNILTGFDDEMDGSPFKSAVLGAMQRSLIHPKIYLNPWSNNVSDTYTDIGIIQHNFDEAICVRNARPQLEYTLVPIAKKGAVQHGSYMDLAKTLIDSAINSRAMASKILKSANQPSHELESDAGCIIFTGTGSAIPCKHRNVTGIYIEMTNNNGMLLDCGEGTIGQLIRSWKSKKRMDISSCLINIKAAWISHPHADHHLGLIRLLSERNAAVLSISSTKDTIDPLIIFASHSVFNFLEEYSLLDPTICSSYIPIDCKETLSGMQHKCLEFLQKSLGIKNLISVPVSHCYESYAVVIEGTSFGKVVYSGDCRPSDRLVAAGQGTDLLIHEATFENGMEEEAVLKKHSTIGEALSVASRMNAKFCLLTHFSQRYPRIPPNDMELPFPVIFAFDFMNISPTTIEIAAKLTHPIRMLYPEDDEEVKKQMIKTNDEAKLILSKPGIFASSAMCN